MCSIFSKSMSRTVSCNPSGLTALEGLCGNFHKPQFVRRLTKDALCCCLFGREVERLATCLRCGWVKNISGWVTHQSAAAPHGWGAVDTTLGATEPVMSRCKSCEVIWQCNKCAVNFAGKPGGAGAESWEPGGVTGWYGNPARDWKLMAFARRLHSKCIGIK